MARKHVELLLEMYRRRTLGEFAESLHPEAELHQASAVPDTDVYYGRDELVRGTRRWLEEWGVFRFIPEDVVDLGDQAFVRVRLHGRGKASGVTLDEVVFHLWTFKDGMPWRCDVFFDEVQLRAAVEMK